MLTSNFGIEGIIQVIALAQFDTIEVGGITGQLEVDPLSQCLVVEVGTHVVCNGDDEGAKITEVAVEGVGLFKELEFDHVSVVAVRV